MKNTNGSEFQILFSLLILLFMGFCFAGESLRDKERWEMEDVKEFLKLPYGAQFDIPGESIDFKVFDTLGGVSGLRIIPEDLQTHKTEGAQFRVCSSDLSVFEVAVFKPASCKAACDLILHMAAGRMSNRKLMLDYYNPSYNDTGDVYSLVNLGTSPRMWRLDTKRGTFIHAKYDMRNQVLKAPANGDVLIKQMGLAVDGLAAVLVDQEKKTGRDEEYYGELGAAFLEAKSRADVYTRPANAAQFDLFLSNVPSQEETNKGLPIEVKKQEKVIAGKPYLLARSDGKAIPVVKVKDPNKVNAKITGPKSKGVESDGISDVQIQATLQGTPYYVAASLRSDGQYQVSFNGSGRQVLRVFCLNKTGKVIQFGEFEVEVEPEMPNRP